MFWVDFPFKGHRRTQVWKFSPQVFLARRYISVTISQCLMHRNLARQKDVSPNLLHLFHISVS